MTALPLSWKLWNILREPSLGHPLNQFILQNRNTHPSERRLKQHPSITAFLLVAIVVITLIVFLPMVIIITLALSFTPIILVLSGTLIGSLLVIRVNRQIEQHRHTKRYDLLQLLPFDPSTLYLLLFSNDIHRIQLSEVLSFLRIVALLVTFVLSNRISQEGDRWISQLTFVFIAYFDVIQSIVVAYSITVRTQATIDPPQRKYSRALPIFLLAQLIIYGASMGLIYLINVFVSRGTTLSGGISLFIGLLGFGIGFLLREFLIHSLQKKQYEPATKLELI